ncbi:ribbon-helix-helix protein, CopG family (plasmid) [Phormidium sp. CLA17]|nr:ribbon-helix-helix protein, CopG family [Leptolyngbya sp. Cla-17]
MSELSNDEMSKVTITAFIEEDLKEGLKALADVERRSMSQMVAVLIERAVIDAAKQGLISDSASKDK